MSPSVASAAFTSARLPLIVTSPEPLLLTTAAPPPWVAVNRPLVSITSAVKVSPVVSPSTGASCTPSPPVATPASVCTGAVAAKAGWLLAFTVMLPVPVPSKVAPAE